MYWQQKAFLRKNILRNVSIRFRSAEYESAVCQAEKLSFAHKSQKQNGGRKSTKWVKYVNPGGRIDLSFVKR